MTRTRYSLAALFLVGIGFHSAQWILLAPQIKFFAQLNPDFHVMQLLSADLWKAHFWAALLYLQQTPPVPNLIYGLVLTWIGSAALQATALILLCALLSCIGSVLFAILLMQLQVSLWASLLAALIFVCGPDILLSSYSTLGQLFYEQLSMVEALCAALAAIALVRHASLQAALWLGVCVSALALTRSTFSYLAIPVLCWVGYVVFFQRKLKLILWFLLPVFLLHGGWAFKQWMVQGEWQWATTSWGGANIQFGDIKRQNAKSAAGWQGSAGEVLDLGDQASHGEPCLARWSYVWKAPNQFGIFGRAAESMKFIDDNFGPSRQAVATDLRAANARGRLEPFDSAAFRELSQCMQKAYSGFWRKHPLRAISNWWQSYGVFWSSISSFADVIPTVLIPENHVWRDPANPPVWQPQGSLFQSSRYFIRHDKLPVFFFYDQSRIEPAKTLVVAFLPGLMALMVMIFVHAVPAVALVGAALKKGSELSWPAGFSFLLLLYVYFAVVCNVAEYGENMRFRLALEPVIWAIGVVCMRYCVAVLAVLWRRFRGDAPINKNADAKAGRILVAV